MATQKPPATADATPENTPVPGGGRWCWDSALPGWAEASDTAAQPVADPSTATPVSTPATEPTPE